MKYYTQLRFVNLSSEQKEVLVALLADIGYDGFEEGPSSCMAYIPEDRFDEMLLTSRIGSLGLNYTLTRLEEQNWNAVWESDFQPVVIDDFCCVRAAFHAQNTAVTHDVIVTPKMSFGTGHHATTYLMISWLKHLDLCNKSVLDFGTGTGVLAILAAKLEAGEVVAIDNDEWSIENAAENFEVNGTRSIQLKKSDFLNEGRRFDIILANINRNVLLAQMGQLAAHLAMEGVLIMSGLLKGDLAIITETAAAHGLRCLECTKKGDWISLQLSHNQ